MEPIELINQWLLLSVKFGFVVLIWMGIIAFGVGLYKTFKSK